MNSPCTHSNVVSVDENTSPSTKGSNNNEGMCALGGEAALPKGSLILDFGFVTLPSKDHMSQEEVLSPKEEPNMDKIPVYGGTFETLTALIANTHAYNEDEIVNDLLEGTSETESESEKPNYWGSDDSLVAPNKDGWASTSSESEEAEIDEAVYFPSLYTAEESDEEDSSSSDEPNWRKRGGTFKFSLSKNDEKVDLSKLDENNCTWSSRYVHTEDENTRLENNLNRMKLLPQLEDRKFLELRPNEKSDLTVKLYGDWDGLNSKNSSDSEEEDGSSSSSNKFIDPWELLDNKTELPFGNSSDSEEEKNSYSSSPKSFNYFI